MILVFFSFVSFLSLKTPVTIVRMPSSFLEAVYQIKFFTVYLSVTITSNKSIHFQTGSDHGDARNPTIIVQQIHAKIRSL